jgi:hypothetical protein
MTIYPEKQFKWEQKFEKCKEYPEVV